MRNLPKGSECWNFMSKCRKLICKFLTWDVGSGDSVFFWEDSWDGHPAISTLAHIDELKQKLISLWGEKVKDYKTKVFSDGILQWRWRPIDNLDLNPFLVKEYEKIISMRGIKQTESMDKLIWVGSKDGKYNVKQGYKALAHSQSWNLVEMPLQLCWDTGCLPKAGFFLWLTLQKRVLTADRLAKFGIFGPSWCVLCKQNSEDAEHLFYGCHFAQSCWEWLRAQLMWSTPLPNSFQALLLSWPTKLDNGVYNKLWNICPSIVVWELWKERNRRIFRNSEMSLERFLIKLEASIVEVLNSHLRKTLKEEGSFSRWDGLIKKRWSNIINPPLVYFKKNKEARASCKWAHPPIGWHKLNFDGAARGNPGMAGIGCIINNDAGKWIAKLAAPLSPTTNNLAELEALDQGLLLCYKLGLSKIIIEGDSQITLNAIRKRDTPNWVLNSKLREVLVHLDRFEDYQIGHIFREGNRIADGLANKGADGQSILAFN